MPILLSPEVASRGARVSLVTRFNGDIKSTKTLSAVYWSRCLMMDIGIPVFTNMKHCIYRNPGSPFHNHRWATTVNMNEVMADMVFAENLNLARFKLCVFLLDEAHLYWEASKTMGLWGRISEALITQAGKRGIIILYTTHLEGMVAPRVRNVTQLEVLCRTDDEGRSSDWLVYDNKESRYARALGSDLPEPVECHLDEAWENWRWYDAEEVIDPFSFARSLGGSKASQKQLKQLERIAMGVDDAEPVDDSERSRVREQASEVTENIIQEYAIDQEQIAANRGRRKVGKAAFGGAQ